MSRQPVKVAWLKWVVSESDEALEKDGRLKYPKLVNEASRTLKQSTQNSKTKHSKALQLFAYNGRRGPKMFFDVVY